MDLKTIKCAVCGKVKVYKQFDRRMNGYLGRNSVCRECSNNIHTSNTLIKENTIITSTKPLVKIEVKVCNRCSSNKPVTEFPVSKRAKSGVSNICKQCVDTALRGSVLITNWELLGFKSKSYAEKFAYDEYGTQTYLNKKKKQGKSKSNGNRKSKKKEK